MNKEPNNLGEITHEQLQEVGAIMDSCETEVSDEAWMDPEIMGRETAEILEAKGTPRALYYARLIRNGLQD